MANQNIGSVSSGTMRPEDLIPDFIWELRHQKPLHRSHRALLREIESRMFKDGYYDSEEASWDLNEGLFDALNDYAPQYFYFGGHPGDGADYGFWLSEDWSEELENDGGIQVDDLADVPKDHYGPVAVVNDHGNVTLYNRARNNRMTELWSVV